MNFLKKLFGKKEEQQESLNNTSLVKYDLLIPETKDKVKKKQERSNNGYAVRNGELIEQAKKEIAERFNKVYPQPNRVTRDYLVQVAESLTSKYRFQITEVNTKLLEVNPNNSAIMTEDSDGGVGYFSPWAHTNVPSYFYDPKVPCTFKRKTWHYRYFFIRNDIFKGVEYRIKDAMLELYNSLNAEKSKLWQETRWQTMKKAWGTLEDFEGYTDNVRKHIFLEDICKSKGVSPEDIVRAISFSLNMNYSEAHDVAVEYGVIQYTNLEQQRIIELHSKRNYYNAVGPEEASKSEKLHGDMSPRQMQESTEKSYTEQLIDTLKKGSCDFPPVFLKSSSDNKYKIARRKAWLFKNFWILGVPEFWKISTFTTIFSNFYNSLNFEDKLGYHHFTGGLNLWFGLSMNEIRTGRYEGDINLRDYKTEPWRNLCNRLLVALSKDCMLNAEEILELLSWTLPSLSKAEIIDLVYNSVGAENLVEVLERAKVKVIEEKDSTYIPPKSHINWNENAELRTFIIQNMVYREDVTKVRSLVKTMYHVDISSSQIFTILSHSHSLVLWREDYDKTKMTATLCAKFLDYIEKHPEVIIRSYGNLPKLRSHTLVNKDLGYNMQLQVYDTTLRMLYKSNLVKWAQEDGTVLRRAGSKKDKPKTNRSVLEEHIDFISSNYPDSTLSGQEYIKFLNEKFKINCTYSSFIQFLSMHKIKKNNPFPVKEKIVMMNPSSGSETEYTTLPKDVSKEVIGKLINYINMHKSTIRVNSAALTWVQHGGLIGPNTVFVHWDDNPVNNIIDNIMGMTQTEFNLYLAKRRKLNTPKGNVELNKSIYQQVLLEKEIKKEKI